MGIIGDIVRRSTSSTVRKEDEMVFWEYKGFSGPLPSGTEKIFNDIHDFLGFSQILPKDIFLDDGDVKVILDDQKTKKVTVSLKDMENALSKYKEELNTINKHLEELFLGKQDSPEIERLRERKEILEGKIRNLNEDIDKCRESGKDNYTYEIALLGYYKPRPDAEIHLMMGSICDYKLAAIVLVHEMMHAYFDKYKYKKEIPHRYYSVIEEPIAEYGMLCFMEMFGRIHPEYKDIYNRAKNHVRSKNDLGICHYGYGNYLYEDKTNFGADWISLFHKYWPTIDENSKEVKDYYSTITPILYPQHERACEWKLYEILKPKAFYFITETEICTDGRMLFNMPVDSKEMDYFLSCYPIPIGSTIQLRIIDKKGQTVSGNASVLKGSKPNIYRPRINVPINLRKGYNKLFGNVKHSFAFYESMPANGSHPAEWVAQEI